MNFLDYFMEISKIPRGSGNMEGISEYCEKFARSRNLSVIRDDYNNVIIYKDATEGYENHEPVILQAHMDMVCEKNMDSVHDFIKDPIEIIEKDGCIYGNNTTLGGDDGIGVAYILAVLGDNTLCHPHITAVFTTDEETGMDGARNLNMDLLKGRYIINIDNDIEDTIFTGSAGGRTLECTIPIKYYLDNGLTVVINIYGLLGGHSGSEINKERGNANILMGRVLKELKKYLKYSLVFIKGGNKDNAIPRDASCEILLDEKDYDRLKGAIEEINKKIKKEFMYSDRDVCVSISGCSVKSQRIMYEEDKDNIIDFLFMVPNGVFSTTDKPEFMVETSSNLGVLFTDDVAVNMSVSVRSMLNERKELLTEKIETVLERCSGFLRVKNEYPEWEYKNNSFLQNIFKETYKKLTGNNLKTTAIHAGLECGYFSRFNNDYDIVSFGPDMYDIHTANEHVNIESAKNAYNLLINVLKEI